MWPLSVRSRAQAAASGWGCCPALWFWSWGGGVAEAGEEELHEARGAQNSAGIPDQVERSCGQKKGC